MRAIEFMQASIGKIYDLNGFTVSLKTF